jgi:PAS domain-containing protein
MSAIEHTTEAIVITDIEGSILNVNPAFESAESTQILQFGDERIILVDDEAAIAHLEKQMLEHLNVLDSGKKLLPQDMHSWKRTGA